MVSKETREEDTVLARRSMRCLEKTDEEIESKCLRNWKTGLISRTPIFYACLGGQAHTLKVMIAELNCRAGHTDQLGRTALHCAAFGGFTACVEVLLDESVCYTSKHSVIRYISDL
ncbi:unnamed protein product [Anisakis simplex]|uniref:Inversin (inferred by orthology to a human protein) n=1 Tax=Anisakis simplex TaxID=6269 RepID=A0A0M3JC82_ANISI|nr:unnamed protein product [Anisakis simplex]